MKMIDIIFLQEPLFVMSIDNIKVPSSISKDYNCFYNSHFNLKALIYAKKTLKCELVTCSSTDNVSTIKLSTKSGDVFLCSPYCPQTDSDPVLSLTPSFSKLNSSQISDCSLAVDSKSHSHYWYDKNTDQRGLELEQFMFDNSLDCLNQPNSLSTFENSIGYSNKDLTIAGHKLYNDIINWEILEADSLSGHRFIEFHICTDPILKQ